MTQDDILNIVAKAIVEEINTDNPQRWREHNTTAFFVAMKAARYAAMEMAKQKDEEFKRKPITEIPTEQ